MTQLIILLTREDLRARHRHNAIFNTIEQLLRRGIIPVVNENDTVSASEIQFGDNDTLSALVASVMHADRLCILSNIPGLMDLKNGNTVIPKVTTITPEIEALAQDTKQTTSVGGMVSKLSAAKIAQRAGCGVTIASGENNQLIEQLMAGESVGTYFPPSEKPVQSHKRWIAILDQVNGKLFVDAGAADAIRSGGKSLLAVGIKKCVGDFVAGDLVSVLDPDNKEIAQGLSRIDHDPLEKIISKGNTSAEVILHYDDLVLL